MSESTEKHLEKIVLELRDGNTRYSIEVLELKNKLNCAVKALEDLLDKNEVLLSELKSIKSRLVRIHNNDDEKITANNLRAECLVIASLIGYEIEAVNPLNISPSMKRARLALEEIKNG